MENHPGIFSESAHLTDDERKILLLGLKVLYADVAIARVLGYPVDPKAIKNLVAKLGGIPSLL